VPKLKAEPSHADAVTRFLLTHGYSDAAARARADLVTISSTAPEPWPLARLRRVGPSLWLLEMPTHTGRWEITAYRAPFDHVLALLVTEFSWILHEARETR